MTYRVPLCPELEQLIAKLGGKLEVQLRRSFPHLLFEHLDQAFGIELLSWYSCLGLRLGKPSIG